MNRAERGILIVVEGLDRAGKSTQCHRLCTNLENDGHRVKQLRFPNRLTPIGKSIDSYLKGEVQVEDHVIHLLFSANRWEAAAQIRSDIENGISIVIDRYFLSGIVYSVAKDNPTLSLDWARMPEVGLPQPDLFLFLQISTEEAAKRGGFGIERYENDKMQKRVRELYSELTTSSDFGRSVIIDADQGFDAVERDVLKEVQQCLQTGHHGCLKALQP